MSNQPTFVCLPTGMVIPLAAVTALLAIERAGHRVVIDGDDLLVEPRGAVDEHDLQLLRRWKHHCVLLLSYTPSDESKARPLEGSRPPGGRREHGSESV